MIEVRQKDIVFALVLVPVLAAGLYFHLWRNKVASRIKSMRSEIISLVSEEEFDDAISLARKRAAEAQKELALEKSAPQPASEINASPSESEAERSRILAAVFRKAGLGIVRCDVVPGEGRSCATLRATGTRPSPTGRLWTLEGSYFSLLNAFKAIVDEKLAVVPVSVSFTPPSRILVNTSL